MSGLERRMNLLSVKKWRRARNRSAQLQPWAHLYTGAKGTIGWTSKFICDAAAAALGACRPARSDTRALQTQHSGALAIRRTHPLNVGESGHAAKCGLHEVTELCTSGSALVAPQKPVEEAYFRVNPNAIANSREVLRSAHEQASIRVHYVTAHEVAGLIGTEGAWVAQRRHAPFAELVAQKCKTSPPRAGGATANASGPALRMRALWMGPAIHVMG
jgi:hypothetical protein